MRFGPYGARYIDVTLSKMLNAGRKAARKVISEAQAGGNELAAETKAAYDGTPDGDIRTKADEAAQTAMEAIRKQSTPSAGVIAEELGLRVACKIPDCEAYWTFDGVDGTRQLAKQFAEGRLLNNMFGISTMAAFVADGKVVAAGIRALVGQGKVQLYAANGAVVSDRSSGEPLILTKYDGRTTPLGKGTALIRGNAGEYGQLVGRLVASCGQTRHFSHYSIGLTHRQLWIEDVVLHVQAPGNFTPWDDTPCAGIALAADFVYLRPSEDGQALEEYFPEPVTEVKPRPHCEVVVHRSRLDQVRAVVPLRLISH